MERPAGFDIVQRPKHYNNHPSGVECIEIIEHMTFNLGNAFKYLWRGGLKSKDATQDYEKALWYVLRDDERRPAYIPTPRSIEIFRAAMLTDNRARRALARPSPWCESVRCSLSFIIDSHCTSDLMELARLNERIVRCIKQAISDGRCLGRGQEP
jgi:hypothetical protein